MWQLVAPAIDEIGAYIIGRAFFWRRKHLPLADHIVRNVYQPFDGDLPRFYSFDGGSDVCPTVIKQTNADEVTIRDLSFPSPLASGIPENDRVVVRHWQSVECDRRMSVVALGGVVQVGYFWFDRFAEALALCGVDCWMMDEPYNSRRTPNGYMPGELVLGGSPEQLIASVRQAIVDARTLIRMLRAQGRRVGVVGQSYGGYLALLLSLVEPELDFVVSMIPLADVPAWYRTALSLPRGVRRRFPRFTAAELEAIAWPINPIAWRPVVLPSRIDVHAAQYDRVVSADCIRRLSERWGTRFTLHPEGHYSLFFGDRFRRQVQSFVLANLASIRVDPPRSQIPSGHARRSSSASSPQPA